MGFGQSADGTFEIMNMARKVAFGLSNVSRSRESGSDQGREATRSGGSFRPAEHAAAAKLVSECQMIEIPTTESCGQPAGELTRADGAEKAYRHGHTQHERDPVSGTLNSLEIGTTISRNIGIQARPRSNPATRRPRPATVPCSRQFSLPYTFRQPLAAIPILARKRRRELRGSREAINLPQDERFVSWSRRKSQRAQFSHLPDHLRSEESSSSVCL
jgi:hypothetical protein